MANNNFVIQNGLTVGPLTINAATGDIITTGNIISSNPGTDTFNVVTANTIQAGASGNITVTGNVLPSANITYALGSRTMMWKDVFVGPGTLYINGTPVLGASTTGTPTINFTASSGQNIAVATNGGGILQLDGGSAGGGYIQVKSPLQIGAGSNITSSDGNAIGFANQIAVDAITSKSANTNHTITANGTGKIALNSDTIITGNLTVNGQTEIINTTVLNVTTQYATLNSGVTGSPTLDAGLRVNRGTSNNAVLKWSESNQAWQISSDNVNFANIVTSGGSAGSASFTSLTAGSITKSGTNGSGDIGQSNNTYATVYATTFSGVSTTAKYADLAENYQGDKTYAPGTVVMFGGLQEVTVADADTTAVAGVVSTNPAHLMNGGLNGANVVAVALTGRVPCMVIGPVKKGDMLVSAGHGYAKSSANPQMGQVIGKALYDFPGSSKAVIEVVVGRL
jgi:hypothetical protein